MGWPPFRLILLFGFALTISAEAFATGPGDDLLKLVRSDSGATLVVEDLRGHAREILGSPLFERLKRLPGARTYLASEGFKKIERGSRDVMAALGLSVETFRDDFLGDAVILAFEPGPANRPDLGQGLLLVRPRDRGLVDPLLKRLNEAQTKSGELAAVEERLRGPVPYKIRKFKAAGRPAEYYAQLDDGTLAWSNSEAAIQGVIDRKLTPGSGLGDDPAFQKVRRGLPDRPFLSLFVNPRLIERLLAENARPVQDRREAMLGRYLGSIRQLGFSLEWGNGLHLHSHEVLGLEKLDPWLKRWLTRPASPVVLDASLPPTAVGVLSANLDFESLRDAAWELTDEEVRPSLDNYKVALQGLLLGRDPSTEILPRLGPDSLLYFDIEPNRALKNRFSLVGVVGWSDQAGSDGLAAPIDNALRTAFALHALDPKRRAAHLRVEPRTLGDARLTLLTDGIRTLLSYRIDRNKVILGQSPEAVAKFGSGQAPALFSGLRGQYFPHAETFAIIDLRRLVDEVRTIRGPIARILATRSKQTPASVDQDLGKLINLAELFQAATFSSTTSKDATEIHRAIRMIAR